MKKYLTFLFFALNGCSDFADPVETYRCNDSDGYGYHVIFDEDQHGIPKLKGQKAVVVCGKECDPHLYIEVGDMYFWDMSSREYVFYKNNLSLTRKKYFDEEAKEYRCKKVKDRNHYK